MNFSHTPVCIAVFVVTINICVSLYPTVWDKDYPYKAKGYSFESSEDITFFRSENAKHSITDLSSKHGTKSLKWDYRGSGAQLVLHDAEGFKFLENRYLYNKKFSDILFWVHNNKPSEGYLVFRVGNQEGLSSGKCRYEFSFHLNFKGWRAGWIDLETDAERKNEDGSAISDMMTIEINDVSEKGTLLFDRIEITEYVHWAREADLQMPYLNSQIGGGPDQPLKSYTMQPEKDKVKVSDAERKAAEEVNRRTFDWLIGSKLSVEYPQTSARSEGIMQFAGQGETEFEKYKIVRKGDYISGVPLVSIHDGILYKSAPLVRDFFNKCIFPMTLAYCVIGSSGKPNKLYKNPELKEKILMGFDYAYSQGWAAGSSMGTCYGLHLGLVGYGHALVLMKNELREHGILDRETDTFKWATHYNRFAGVDLSSQRVGDADEMRTTAILRLLYILSLGSVDEMALQLRRYSHWLNACLAVNRALHPTIKPDFSVFHHSAPYWNGYGTYGLYYFSLLGYLLRATPFAIGEQEYNNLKQALLVQRFTVNKYHWPVFLNGRWPFWEAGSISTIGAYGYAAAIKAVPDPELAAAFKRLCDMENPAVVAGITNVAIGNSFTTTVGDTESMMRFYSNFGFAEKTPQGHLACPYAAASFHRRNEWLAAVKGWSKYIWDFETGSSSPNDCGRYLSRGAIVIYSQGNPVAMKQSGYDPSGWDWSRFPGTTVLHLDHKSLTVGAQGNPSRMHTDQTFVGGLSHRGSNGIFVLKLHDIHYEKGFTAHKTVFFIDDMIVSLGSTIANNNTQTNTETILFQNRLDNPEDATLVNGSAQKSIPYTYSPVNNNAPQILLDSKKTGYYIPKPGNLSVLRQEQTAQKAGLGTGGKGFFEVAFINHGKSPSSASYEYVILPMISTERLKAFTVNPPYRVIRNDEAVHIIESGMMRGYAFYDNQVKIQDEIIFSVDRQSIIYLEKTETNLILTAADPDIGAGWLPEKFRDLPWNTYGDKEIYAAKVTAKPRPLKVILHGNWQSYDNDKNVSVISKKNARSEITVLCQDGISYEIRLNKKK